MKDRMKSAHIDVACRYADLSYARRLKVGAIVVEGDKVISIGYNGTEPGADNNCEIEPPDWDGDIAKLKTKPDVIHAEDNALRKLVESHDHGDYAPSLDDIATGCTMFITHAPCAGCADKIIKAGISAVIYKHKYRDEDGINHLLEHGVKVEQWQPQNTSNAIAAKQFSK